MMSDTNLLSEQLKEAVSQAIDEGYTRYAIAKRAGLKPYVLTQWYDEGKDIRLDTAAKLAEIFGMRLTRHKKLRD